MFHPQARAAALCVALTLVLPAPQGFAVDTQNPDWPCVQRKQENLTAAQMWDGPAITGDEKWWKDEEVRKLVPLLVNRRLTMEELEEDIIKLAEATPEAERDARMTLLFAGVLDETNKVRRRIVEGIERFQRRQRDRAAALELKGEEIAKLHQRAEAGEKISDEISAAETAYDWDARIFQERQANIPIACEIPVEIEQRAFALARSIRFQMTE